MYIHVINTYKNQTSTGNCAFNPTIFDRENCRENVMLFIDQEKIKKYLFRFTL